MSRIAFIIGSDRSGTHWIAKTLQKHPDCKVTLERAPQFVYSWGMAANREKIPELFSKMQTAYEAWLRDCGTEWYIDKAHMNICVVDELLEAFPNAKFIAADRNPYATVSSMLQHAGIRGDLLIRWTGFTMPSLFCGARSVEQYMRLSLPQRCAAKWELHHLYLQDLQEVLSEEQIYIVQYERFAADPMGVIGEVEDFLGLDHLISEVEVKHESVDKWKDLMSPQEIEEVKRFFNATARAKSKDE